MRSRWGLAPYALALGISASMLLRMPTRIAGVRYMPLFDDAMISMRYGRNLADGHGLVFNAGGHRVEGYTNLLWTVMMAALHALPVPTRLVTVAVSLVGIGCVLVSVWLAGRLTELLLPGTTAPAIARWFVAGTYSIVFWSTIGMEVGVVAVLCLAATFLVVRFTTSSRSRDVWWAGAALAAAVVTRPDAIVV